MLRIYATAMPQGGVAMPLLITVLAPGFVGSESLQLAVTDARLMLPYLAFAGPAAVIMSLLNARHRFAITAFSPLLFNVALIIVISVLLLLHQDSYFAALVMAVLMNTLLPQTTGLEWARPGIGVFHLTFTALLASHFTAAGEPSATPAA